MLDTSPAVVTAAETAIREVLGAVRIPRAGFRPVQGKYTFTQLAEWHERHRLVTLSVPGVVMASVKESENRLLVGVKDASVTSGVERALRGTGIPPEAVSIEVKQPARFTAQTLVENVRPVVGGLQIQTFPGKPHPSCFRRARLNGENHSRKNPVQLLIGWVREEAV